MISSSANTAEEANTPAEHPAGRPSADVARALDHFRRIVRGLRLAEQRTRMEAGLSAAQLFVLTQLAGAPARSLGELAERTLTDRSSVAAVVDRLVAAGLASAQRDEEDRRRVVVQITEAGRQLLAAAPPAPTTLLVQALNGMAEGDLRSLATGLQQFVAALGWSGEPAGLLFEEPSTTAEGARSRDR